MENRELNRRLPAFQIDGTPGWGQKFDHAKGYCYAAAFALLERNAIRMTDKVWLCHGIVTQTDGSGRRMGHAWLEEYRHGQWFVRDGLYPTTCVPIETYYAIGGINPADIVRYSWTQARHLRRQLERFGPWDDRIAAADHSE